MWFEHHPSQDRIYVLKKAPFYDASSLGVWHFLARTHWCRSLSEALEYDNEHVEQILQIGSWMCVQSAAPADCMGLPMTCLTQLELKLHSPKLTWPL